MPFTKKIGFAVTQSTNQKCPMFEQSKMLYSANQNCPTTGGASLQCECNHYAEFDNEIYYSYRLQK